MTVLGRPNSTRWSAPLAIALVASSTLALSVFCRADEPQAKAPAPSSDGGKLARETFSALRELHAAVESEAKSTSASGATAGVPDRPKKKITPPTLTSAELDALADAFLESTKAPAASVTTDVEFVRRIYLDVTGKLPTPDQTRAFVLTREKDKRGKLIEHLLDSHDYAENWARYWRDVIKYHATVEQPQRAGFAYLETWLTKEIARNRPWDEVAKELMTASGRADENGAVSLSLSHDSSAVELAGEVSRIFLGVQIQCAQCHDHPNDSWKRQQFHEFASFFAGSQTKRATAQGVQPQVFEVQAKGKPRYTMPDLKDPQKSIPVAPKFFLASDSPSLPASLSQAERQALAASYVTGQDNPWFAKAFVNRIWYVLMGDAFYMPVDDLGPDRTAKAPEVLEALATQWQNGGYDVKWLFRVILNSKAYQREVRSTYSASGRTPFAANCASRLRADQIIDSLAQALNIPLDSRPGNLADMAKKAMLKKGLGADLKETVGKTKGGGPGQPGALRFQWNQLFGVDPSIANDEILGTIPQALFLMNAPQINRAMEARPGTVLGDILTATPDNRTALENLYLRVLARDATPKEVQTCGRYIDTVGDRREAFEDILWSLINSTEFITRR